MEILKHCLLSHWPVPLHRDFLDFVVLSAATGRSLLCLYVDHGLASGNRLSEVAPGNVWKWTTLIYLVLNFLPDWFVFCIVQNTFGVSIAVWKFRIYSKTLQETIEE